MSEVKTDCTFWVMTEHSLLKRDVYPPGSIKGDRGLRWGWHHPTDPISNCLKCKDSLRFIAKTTCMPSPWINQNAKK